MKKTAFWHSCAAVLVLALAPFVAVANDDEDAPVAVTNLSVERLGDGNLRISWDVPEGIAEIGAEGIALQWGDNLGDIGEEASIRHRLDRNETELTIRGADFIEDERYYFFATPFKRGGYKDRDTLLLECVEGIGWEDNGDGTYEEIATDVKCDDHEEDDDDTDTTTVNTDNPYRTSSPFGPMLIKAYESDILLRWKLPRMSSKDLEKVIITVADNKNMNNPLMSFGVDPRITTARIMGAAPNTKYFIQGHYERDEKRLTESDVFETKTEKKYDAARMRQFQIYSKNGIIKLDAGISVNLSDGSTTAAASASNSNMTFGSSTPQTAPATTSTEETTVKTKGKGQLKRMSNEELIEELNEVRAYLRNLMLELRNRNRT